jgi:putative transposase
VLTKLVTMKKRLTALEIFNQSPEVKIQFWGGKFWGKGYFFNTVGQYGQRGNGTEKMIAKFIRNKDWKRNTKPEKGLTTKTILMPRGLVRRWFTIGSI